MQLKKGLKRHQLWQRLRLRLPCVCVSVLCAVSVAVYTALLSGAVLFKLVFKTGSEVRELEFHDYRRQTHALCCQANSVYA